MDESSPQPWERGAYDEPVGKTETAKAYQAFEIYRDLGPDRSTAKVQQIIGKSKRQIDKWSGIWHWVERVRAFDSRRSEQLLEARAELDSESTEEFLRDCAELDKEYAKAAEEMKRRALEILDDTEAGANDLNAAKNLIQTAEFTARRALESRAYRLGLKDETDTPTLPRRDGLDSTEESRQAVPWGDEPPRPERKV